MSPVVGTVAVSLDESAAITVSYPFETIHDTAAMLAGDAEDGELLHVWTDSAFNVYQLVSGQWQRRIGNSSTQAPLHNIL